MTDEFIERAADFLTYVAYRDREYYKIFGLIKAFSESIVAEQEANQLQFIGVDGFKALINKPKYLELLDAVVKREYPEAIMPERKLTNYELALKMKNEELFARLNKDIDDLAKEIKKAHDEKKQLSEELAEQRRVNVERERELKSRIVDGSKKFDEEKRKLSEREREVKKKESEIASLIEKHKKDFEAEKHKRQQLCDEKLNKMMKLNGELTQSRADKLKLEGELETLKASFEKAMTELNSRRIEANRLTLQAAEDTIKREELNTQAAELAAKESRLTSLEAELAPTQDFCDFKMQEKKKEIR